VAIFPKAASIVIIDSKRSATKKGSQWRIEERRSNYTRAVITS
jgi:hypothetical protein